MTQRAEALEKLTKQGEDLKDQASDDRSNMGAQKADDTKVEKRDQVKREVSAAVSATMSLAREAKKGAREAEEFAEDLKHAFAGKAGEPRAKKHEEKKHEEKKHEEKKPARPAKPPEPHKPTDVAKPPEVLTKKPEEKKPGPTPSATTKPEEVFNP